jgi:hypothetical protein
MFSGKAAVRQQVCSTLANDAAEYNTWRRVLGIRVVLVAGAEKMDKIA